MTKSIAIKAAQIQAPGAARFRGFGLITLLAAHCAGMVDLVALPVWVGTLIGNYRLDPQRAGSLATFFLVGAVVSSGFLSPRLNRLQVRWIATVGFAVAAAAFALAGMFDGYGVMAGLHLLAGLCVGSSLSVTHGTIGRSANPHRLFAVAGLSIGCFAIVFLGVTPELIAAYGGKALFQVFSGVMAVAAFLSAVAFPVSRLSTFRNPDTATRIHPPIWFGMAGVACMGLTQAMVFAFIQRIGLDRGFGQPAVTSVLVALGLVNLLPAPLAVFLEARFSGLRVVKIGVVAQAVIAFTLVQSTSFAPFAVCASVFAAVMIFSHTFAFGILARLDTTGRAVAATPAMLMSGAALGPILGGTLVMHFGYASLGAAAVPIAGTALVCFSRLSRCTSSIGDFE